MSRILSNFSSDTSQDRIGSDGYEIEISDHGTTVPTETNQTVKRIRRPRSKEPTGNAIRCKRYRDRKQANQHGDNQEITTQTSVVPYKSNSVDAWTQTDPSINKCQCTSFGMNNNSLTEKDKCEDCMRNIKLIGNQMTKTNEILGCDKHPIPQTAIFAIPCIFPQMNYFKCNH